MSDTIPTRFNANAVNRYSKTLHALCDSWPEPILVNPAPLSVETYRSRFRDAMVGVTKYRQGPADLQVKLLELSEPVVVSEQLGLLKIGPKSVLRLKPENALQAGLALSGVATLNDNSKALVAPDTAAIRAIALLTGMGFLSGARVSGVTEEFIWENLPPDYDGGVVANADGTLTIY